MVFKSKIDSWLLVILVAGIAGQVMALFSVAAQEIAGTEKTIIVSLLLVGILLMLSVLLRTHYTVSEDKVTIVSGPFSWSFLVSEIDDVSDSRSLLSSPALSLDRMRIRYRGNRHILVSPEDKAGFLRAIGKDLEL